jgi:hypothetical protein
MLSAQRGIFQTVLLCELIKETPYENTYTAICYQ